MCLKPLNVHRSAQTLSKVDANLLYVPLLALSTLLTYTFTHAHSDADARHFLSSTRVCVIVWGFMVALNLFSLTDRRWQRHQRYNHINAVSYFPKVKYRLRQQSKMLCGKNFMWNFNWLFEVSRFSQYFCYHHCPHHFSSTALHYTMAYGVKQTVWNAPNWHSISITSISVCTYLCGFCICVRALLFCEQMCPLPLTLTI